MALDVSNLYEKLITALTVLHDLIKSKKINVEKNLLINNNFITTIVHSYSINFMFLLIHVRTSKYSNVFNISHSVYVINVCSHYTINIKIDQQFLN